MNTKYKTLRLTATHGLPRNPAYAWTPALAFTWYIFSKLFSVKIQITQLKVLSPP
jgi:hypothetical protein